MPRPPLPDDVLEMLARPNPATMTCLDTSGQPVSVATWYLLEGQRIRVNLDAGRKRLAYLRADPRVALTVLDGEDWYTHVSIDGHVVEIADDEGLAGIDAISRHYTGQEYRLRDRPRVDVWVEVDRWHGWGAKKTSFRGV